MLVVDDHAENRRLLGESLLSAGYEVFVAGDGPAALEVAAGVELDLILLDVMMPGMDGFETCRRLRLLPACAPVVFLTALHDTDAMTAGFDAGGADYVTKPFDVRVLLARVRTHASLGRYAKAIRADLDRRGRELQSANSQLVRLTRALAAVEERERRELAEALHDGPIQDLALGRIQLDLALASDDLAGCRRAVGATADLLSATLQEMRSLLFEISPPAMSGSGLADALRRLAEHVGRNWPMSVDFDSSGEPARVDEGYLLVLFRAARELLVNAAKHSGSGRASLHLGFTVERVSVVVMDSGGGFDPHGDQGEGFGLRSVRERLALYGGGLVIESGQSGTRAEASLPLPAPGP